MAEVWLKRCLNCGGYNGPLATKCEHCAGSMGFEWREEDRPPALTTPTPPVQIRGIDRGMDHYWTHSNRYLSG